MRSSLWVQGVVVAGAVAGMQACAAPYAASEPSEGDAAVVAPVTEDASGVSDAADDRRAVGIGDGGGGAQEGGAAIDGGDGGRVGIPCPPTPSACTGPATTCADNCHVTYNTCKAGCASASLMSCLSTCASQEATCEVPCKGNCVTCANAAASCSSEADCEAKMFRP